jgi:chromosomal replication initiator protein
MAVESPRWDAAREALRQRLSAHVYTSWISRRTVLEDDGTVLRLGLPDQFAVDWVNTHYRKLLEEEVRPWSLELSMARTDETLIPQPSTLPTPALAVPSSLPMPAGGSSSPAPAQVSSLPTPAPVHESMIPTLVPTGGSEGQLNARYTFQNFVSGPANELAYSACQAIVESRMPIYNPLVLVGSTGLGKTHLLHAIAHALAKKRPNAVVQAKTSEHFINDVVRGIRTGRMEDVRRQYRACDVLLIDDIQFISGKEACQEEFFHTFNSLYDAQKQIVVTSDRLPHEITDVQERVKTRFAWGLIADLKLPELETRIAILKKKAEADGIVLDDDVAAFIATTVRTNIRELEGCLVRVHAFAALTQQPATVVLARDVLKGMVSERSRTVNCDVIVKTVSQVFDVKVAELKSTKRARNIALPRQIAMYLCRKHTGSSYPEIGVALGGKDHTTALAAYKTISGRLTDPDVRSKVDEIERLLFEAQ